MGTHELVLLYVFFGSIYTLIISLAWITISSRRRARKKEQETQKQFPQ